MGIGKWCAAGVGGVAVCFTSALYLSVQPLPTQLGPSPAGAAKAQVLDRQGTPLSITFANGWNVSDERPLHQIPPFLQRAFIESEDRRFFEHSGVDWRARAHAVWQNLRSRRVVRGASTITEQVVRMLHPRPRSLWARLIEGVEATQLEKRFSKNEILEFYLNQVPYAAKRRGVVQAARYYFDRDLETLTPKEQLALTVLVRAPVRLDLYTNKHGVDAGISRLAAHLVASGDLSAESSERVQSEELALSRATLPVRADHFVRYVQSKLGERLSQARVTTTIDSHIQERTRAILEVRVKALASKQVSDGAVLVIDNSDASVLAWVNAGVAGESDGSQIDAVTSARQPGSTFKPFLYALALSRGWTAATIVDDAPLAQAVGAGLHSYRNYSRTHYGPVTVREALGNSLNIPAIKAVQYTGKREFLDFMRDAGFGSLKQPSEHYGEGLALGNGEVTLFELVQGYAALAHQGVLRPLRVVRGETPLNEALQQRRILSPEVSSIIASILSDPEARRREFGSGGVLRFPVHTAVKTGTSTDYRDAWAVGYSANFTVGVWMGNLDRTPMLEVTGSKGPALVLRSVFAELERTREPKPLYESPSLLHRRICPHTGLLSGAQCPAIEERFVDGTEPQAKCSADHGSIHDRHEVTIQSKRTRGIRISLPTPGLNIARDPRIPDELEAFSFELSTPEKLSAIHWLVDGKKIAQSAGDKRKHLWALVAGHHEVKARVVIAESGEEIETEGVGFWVR